MTWFLTDIGQAGGGGGDLPNFSATKLVDNTSKSATLSFSDDYHNYPILYFVCEWVNPNDPSIRETHYFATTPDICDEIFLNSSNALCLNILGTNRYALYRKTNTTSWSRYAQRDTDCIEVYGISCDKTVTATTLYQRGDIGSSSVSITSVSSLYDYDIIFFSTCTSTWDETCVCEMPYFKTNHPTFFEGGNSWAGNKYNSSAGIVVSEYIISSYSYFMVQGIKFS